MKSLRYCESQKKEAEGYIQCRSFCDDELNHTIILSWQVFNAWERATDEQLQYSSLVVQKEGNLLGQVNASHFLTKQ